MSGPGAARGGLPGPSARRGKGGLASAVRARTGAGAPVILEESRLLPLVDIQLIFRTGAVHDPRGLQGLCRLTANLIRMGTRKRSAQTVEEAIDGLGAHLSIHCGYGSVHFAGSVVERNLEPFLRLLGELVTGPAFRRRDLDLLKRETIADIAELCDHDAELAARHFRGFALGRHPYGRTAFGTGRSVGSIRREHVLRFYSRHFVQQNLLVGAAGAVSADRLIKLIDDCLGALPAGRASDERVPPPRMRRGRRVLVIDKPDRTQSQIIIGTLGTRARDRDFFPLLVGNTVFGGTFTSRLMREIRSRRGWSYGTGSRLSKDRQRDLWSMWAFPAAADAPACIALQIGMLEALIDRGITGRELGFVKKYLIKSHAFDIDTASKRLGLHLDAELLGLGKDFYADFEERIRAVTREQVNASLRRRLSKSDLAIVLVATARDIREQLARLPGIALVRTVPYDADL